MSSSEHEEWLHNELLRRKAEHDRLAERAGKQPKTRERAQPAQGEDEAPKTESIYEKWSEDTDDDEYYE